ncbi:MAG: ABC transporter permease subunit, partial [Candidatus Micrarchaeaceae archaeon]
MIVFFLSGIWYLIFSILAHRTSIQSEVFEVKRLFGVRGITAWKSIYLRGILPGMITGSVTGIAAEWNASIVAEYFTSAGVSAGKMVTQVHTGIGAFMDQQLALGHLGLIALALINLVVMIVLINRFVWKRAYNRASEVYR